MAKRKTANISLTPDLKAFVEAQVSSGRYQSASEVVRESLRLLQSRGPLRVQTLAEFRREVRVGLDQARSGRLVDGPATFRRIRAKLAKQSRERSRRRAG